MVDNQIMKSKRFPIIVSIYEQVQENPFFSKQTGLSQSDVRTLHLNGDISIVKPRQMLDFKKYKTTVSLYKLTHRSINAVLKEYIKDNIDLHVKPITFSDFKVIKSKVLDNAYGSGFLDYLDENNLPRNPKIPKKYEIHNLI